MASKEENLGTKLDWLKWALVAVLLLGGFIANSYYSAQPWPLRLLGWLLLLCIVFGTAAFTGPGKKTIAFAQDARMELRKVVWPTRQETMQTTLVVAAMVVILALILWGVDGVLMWAIGWLTGQRG